MRRALQLHSIGEPRPGYNKCFLNPPVKILPHPLALSEKGSAEKEGGITRITTNYRLSICSRIRDVSRSGRARSGSFVRLWRFRRRCILSLSLPSPLYPCDYDDYAGDRVSHSGTAWRARPTVRRVRKKRVPRAVLCTRASPDN